MRKLLLSSLLLFFIGLCPLYAQAETRAGIEIQWVKTLGQGTARAVQQCGDGGYIMTGWTKGRPGKGSDIFVLKTNRQGDIQWKTILHGNGFSCAYGLGLTDDGGAIVAGDTKSKTADDHDVLIVKIDQNGKPVWERNYGGRQCDYGAAVVTFSDGGCLIAGGTESFGSGLYDVYLLRLDNRGRTIWTKTYGGKGSDCGYALLPTDGGFVIAGSTDSTPTGKSRVYLFKVDAKGRLVWEHNYGGRQNSYGWSVQKNTAGGFAIAGETEVSGDSGGGFRPYMVQTDARGKRLREHIYGDRYFGTAYALSPASGRALLLAGKRDTSGGRHQSYILGINPEGQAVGEQILTDLDISCIYAAQRTGDGAVVLAGEKGSAANGSQQIMLIKLAPHRSLVIPILLGLCILVLFYIVLVQRKRKSDSSIM